MGHGIRYTKSGTGLVKKHLVHRDSDLSLFSNIVRLCGSDSRNETESLGAWVAQWFKPLPSARVMISGSCDQVPHRALCLVGSLLPFLSLCLPLCLLVISVCQINFKNLLKKGKCTKYCGSVFIFL